LGLRRTASLTELTENATQITPLNQLCPENVTIALRQNKERRITEIFLKIFETFYDIVRIIVNEQKSEARIQKIGDFEICDL
jgi:hypothetical protein